MSVIAATTWAVPHVARACSCLPPPAPAVARDQADAVFEARVDDVESADSSGAVLRYDLAVLRVFKGELGSQTPLMTRSSPAACGRNFIKGKRYLVYAYRTPEGDLGDTMCSRTRQIATADEDLAALGAGAPPPAPAAPETANREPPRIEPAGEGPPAVAAPTTARRGCDLGGTRGPGLVVLLALFYRRRPPLPR